MSKRLLLLSAGLVAAALIGLTLFGKMKSNSSSEEKENPAFASYISAYTSGIISTESTIRILLTNEIEAPIEIGKPIENTLFDFSPSIKGTAVRLYSRTIEFRPENPLPSNTNYNAACYFFDLI